MPVPTHFKITARGRFLQTPEIWSIGFHMSRDVAGQEDAHVGLIHEDQVNAALAAYFSNARFSTMVKVDDWRAYQIGTDGKMEGNPKIVDVTGAGIQGTGTIQYPTQVALCQTLVAANRGPARFGRFFAPSPSTPLDNDGRISSNDANNWVTATTAFLKAVSDAIDLPLASSAAGLNVSPGGGDGAGTKQEIDHVEVGRVVDVIRTRRNHMLEERRVGGHIDW